MSDAADYFARQGYDFGCDNLDVIRMLNEFAAEHVRELLADDEATIEAMARAAYGGEWHTRSDETQAGYIAEARAALAALRRKALGE